MLNNTFIIQRQRLTWISDRILTQRQCKPTAPEWVYADYSRVSSVLTNTVIQHLDYIAIVEDDGGHTIIKNRWNDRKHYTSDEVRHLFAGEFTYV